MNGEGYYLIYGYFVLWFFVFAYLMRLGLKIRMVNRKLSQFDIQKKG